MKINKMLPLFNYFYFVSDRHEEFKKLERSLEQLAEMFFQIQALVQQQGEMIDRIEDQVDSAKAYVEAGTKDLKVAVQYKNKNRKMRIIIACVGSVLLLIIILSLLTSFDVF